MNDNTDKEKQLFIVEYLSQFTDVKFLGFENSPIIVPQEIWSYVATMSTKPKLKLPHSKLLEVNNHWWKLANEYSLLSSDKLLISIGVKNLGSLPWIIIEIKKDSNIIQTLSLIKNEPEFVCISLNSDSFIGVTTEEHGIWIFGSNVEKDSNGKINFFN